MGRRELNVLTAKLGGIIRYAELINNYFSYNAVSPLGSARAECAGDSFLYGKGLMGMHDLA